MLAGPLTPAARLSSHGSANRVHDRPVRQNKCPSHEPLQSGSIVPSHRVAKRLPGPMRMLPAQAAIDYWFAFVVDDDVAARWQRIVHPLGSRREEFLQVLDESR